MVLGQLKQKGQTLVEIVISIGLFVTIAGGITILVLGSLISERQGGEVTEATLYAEQGAEAVRAISNQAWNKLAAMDDVSTHGLDNSSGTWDFFGINNTNGKFTRTVDVNTITRDGNGSINPGNSDLETKEIIVTTSWAFMPGRTNQIQSVYNLTNWNRGYLTETTDADFNDGIFSSTVASSNSVVLTGGGSGGTETKNWDFSISGDYNYDPAKVEVTAGQASLVVTGGGTVSGGTTDPGFDTGTPWTSGCWDFQTGNETCTVSRQTTGGNPGAYGRINLGARKDRQVGGYFVQSFTTTVNDPDVTVNLDYRPFTVTLLTGSDTAYFYVFVENTPGAPSGGLPSAVWSQQVTASSAWQSGISFDDNDLVTTAGTYYLKIAMRLETVGGTNGWRYFNGGYDNTQLNWSKTTLPTYPSDKPTINPTAAWTPSGIVSSWSNFTETATKNGGEIYYQLSSDAGLNWQYWNGSAWVAAVNPSDYNTATIVNAQIGSFSVGSGTIMFKAFLSSDGTYDVLLDNLQVTANFSSGYPTLGTYESSNLGTAANFNLLKWTENLLPATDLKVQIKTAPDSGGSPGVWSATWCGPEGEDGDETDFFTNPAGELIHPDHVGDNWIKYLLTLTGDGTVTPALLDIIVNYKP